jgi:hypothetical protein
MAMQQAWRLRRGDGWPAAPATPRWAGGRLPDGLQGDADEVRALRAMADAACAGSWTVLSACADVTGSDPDWHRDPLTGRRAPPHAYGFAVPYRSEAEIGNVKHLWELSRLHHVTVLAAAYHQTGDRRYGERAAAHLLSWWQANPPLCGVHWVSGIELALRLVAWVWTRRLMAGYPGIEDIFERSTLFQRQLHAHQTWLAVFRSRYSSANNHLIAELAGLLASSLAFPLFEASAGWARQAAQQLELEGDRQTFADGLNRELASGYHTFVLELLLVAGCEADAAGAPLSEGFWRRVQAMADALAATVDVRLHPARQGDGDDGRALVVAAQDRTPTEVVLEACANLLTPAPWWPSLRQGGLAATILTAMARRREPTRERARARPSHFPDAGISILRDLRPDCDELWCRLDHARHGFLATAAHAHADALSFELRLGGQEILVDPGTYCYHGEPEWRSYFRSTVAHNAMELKGHDQAAQAGPFLWLTHPACRLLEARGLDDGCVAEVEASHGAYGDAGAGITHRRRLVLDRARRRLDILDVIEATKPQPVRLAFALHPAVSCNLARHVARLSWLAAGEERTAALILPADLGWSAHRGETDPILGWYSARFGHKEPATLLIGVGSLAPGRLLCSSITFALTTATAQAAMRFAESSEIG